MDEKDFVGFTRRRFMGSVSCLVLGGSWIHRIPSVPIQEKQKRTFRQPFSSEEKKIIGQSSMANNIESYLDKRYSCAEAIFSVSLEALGCPENWVHASASFGGGLGRGDLCGLLTGGMMAIGVAGGKLHQDRDAMKQWVRQKSDAYWAWWETWGPVHCRQLRTQYEGREEFLMMSQRVAAKMETIIQPAFG